MAIPREEDEKEKLKLDTLRKKEEEESTKLLAGKLGFPYVDLNTLAVEVDALKILSEERARAGELVIMQIVGNHLKIALHNPEKDETKAILKTLEEGRYTYEIFIGSRRGLEHSWQVYRIAPEKHEINAGVIQVANDKIAALQKELKDLARVKEKIEATYYTRVTDALEIILAGALALDASDVHIEPQPKDMRLRMRVDGMLYDVTLIPSHLYHLLLSRIKLVSGIKLNIHDRAQDGRFTIRVGETDIEVRTSSLPGPNGENVVMRVLNPKTIQITFDELGMQPWIADAMNRELKRPNGMILTTGPTGSGKTTTLYSFLRKVHTSSIKIITIEDPIEYHLKGIEQTQVDAERGYDFANGLRSIVRQDPDVVLVGEIRDLETAEIAMHAALTGHLVFSTLHTNNAAGTVPRLLDLGVKPAIIAPAINVAMAQRLLRKLCTACKIPRDPAAAEKTRITNDLRLFPKGSLLPKTKEWKIFSAAEKGCDQCSFLGYRGRIGVFEIIIINEEIEKLIIGQPSEFELKREAARQGQISMKQDGLLKVLAGVTDFSEAERVLGGEK